MQSNFVEKNKKEKLCVAQVIGTYKIADGGGGAQRLAYNLALGLAEIGFRSVAIALRADAAKHSVVDPGFRFVPFGTNPKRPLTLLKTFIGLRRLIRDEGIDLLHVHGAPSLPFVAISILGMTKPPRLVFTWQDSGAVLEQTGIRRWLMLWALKQCDAVSGSSRAVAKLLEVRADLHDVGVFHGGVPITDEPQINASSCPVVVWVGRIVPPKDPQILVRAAAVLKREGYKFRVHIVGGAHVTTAWYMDETKLLIKEQELEDTVNLTGFMSDVDLELLMQSADISVQTSHTEGMSIALMEHMMAGLAIVATDVGDTRFAVEDGHSGVIIPSKDERSLVNALRTMLADVELRIRMSRLARNRAVDYFSIHAMSVRAANQYRSLVLE